MNENTKELLANYYLGFCARRKSHFRDNWVTTFIKRIWNRDSSAKSLLKAEIDFESMESIRFSRFVDEENVNAVDINDYLNSLKLLKDEMTNRNTFIIVNVAIVGILVKMVVDYFMQAKYEALNTYFMLFISFFLIALLIERDGLNKRSSASSQLVTVIEKWLTENVQNQ